MTYARCGGTFLAQVLGSTGLLGRPEDWFNGRGYRDRGETAYPLDRAGQREMMLSRGMTPNGVFGLKLSPLRFDDFAGYDWASGLGELAFVHLIRRDRLARALSDVKARQTRQYRSTSAVRAEARYDDAMIHHALTSQAADEGRVQRYFAMNGIRPLEIAYEDLVDDTEAAVRRVASLLAVATTVHVDFDRVDLRIQRDRLNADWRERFIGRNRGLARMAMMETGLSNRVVRRLRALMSWRIR